MNIFTRIWHWIKSLKFPDWLKDTFEYVITKIVMPTLSQLTEGAIIDLKRWIIEASKHDDWDGTVKIKYVVEKFWDEYGSIIKIEKHLLNLVIEIFVAELKRQGFIK